MKRKTDPGGWRALALTGLALAVAAVGLCAQPQAGSQPQSTDKQCTSSHGAANTRTESTAPSAPMTRAQGEEILRQLHAIRLLLENGGGRQFAGWRRVSPHAVKLHIDPAWYALGQEGAPVTMIEFADLQCPFCRRFQDTTFAEIKKDYIDTGKLRFIARDLPLPMHPYALGAAQAERCAGDQGKFWQFRDAVLTDQEPPTQGVLLKHATELRLDLKEYQTCLNEGRHEQQIQAGRRDATALGLHGTPAFVIGRVDHGVLVGVAMQGARPFQFFQQIIDSALRGTPAGLGRTQPAAVEASAP
ncbi:MAG: DsbA family protein [Terriglobia bacterium]